MPPTQAYYKQSPSSKPQKAQHQQQKAELFGGVRERRAQSCKPRYGDQTCTQHQQLTLISLVCSWHWTQTVERMATNISLVFAICNAPEATCMYECSCVPYCMYVRPQNFFLRLKILGMVRFPVCHVYSVYLANLQCTLYFITYWGTCSHSPRQQVGRKDAIHTYLKQRES